MNAIDLILADHKNIRKFLTISLKEIKSGKKDRKAIFNALTRELTLHEKMEQTFWYPLIKVTAFQKIISHLLKEEKEAEHTIKKLKKMKANSDDWVKEFKAFKMSVLHHAKEEQERLLPKVKKHISPPLLEYIGQKMIAFKKKSLKGKSRIKKTKR